MLPLLRETIRRGVVFQQCAKIGRKSIRLFYLRKLSKLGIIFFFCEIFKLRIYQTRQNGRFFITIVIIYPYKILDC